MRQWHISELKYSWPKICARKRSKRRNYCIIVGYFFFSNVVFPSFLFTPSSTDKRLLDRN